MSKTLHSLDGYGESHPHVTCNTPEITGFRRKIFFPVFKYVSIVWYTNWHTCLLWAHLCVHSLANCRRLEAVCRIMAHGTVIVFCYCCPECPSFTVLPDDVYQYSNANLTNFSAVLMGCSQTVSDSSLSELNNAVSGALVTWHVAPFSSRLSYAGKKRKWGGVIATHELFRKCEVTHAATSRVQAMRRASSTLLPPLGGQTINKTQLTKDSSWVVFVFF